MSLPILLGSKSVSSRPQIVRNTSTDSNTDKYYADDGMTPLDSVPIPGPVLTATAVCPRQEWLAMATIEYCDMIMVVDDDDNDVDDGGESDDDDDDDDGNNDQDQHERDALLSHAVSSGKTRRRVARHSTVAQVEIQISPLALPFSSAYQIVTHRIRLPQTSTVTLDDHHYLEHSINTNKTAPAPTVIPPQLVFSSDRGKVACLIPYPRGSPQTALVAFTLQRPPRSFGPPPPRPKLPSYIPTPSFQKQGNHNTAAAIPTRVLPQALADPEYLQLPSNAIFNVDTDCTTADPHWWLHNITSICNASTVLQQQQQNPLKHKNKGTSVLLAGCRDGSILGISFYPFLLAGRLHRPSNGMDHHTKNFEDPAITFLSHITTTQSMASSSEDDTDREVQGRLVAIRASGDAEIFQTRMALSCLVAATTATTAVHNRHQVWERGGDSYHVIADDFTSTGAEDVTETSYATVGSESAGVVMIHGESFQVAQKTGRRNSLLANTRLSESLLPHMKEHSRQQQISSVVGTTGLFMFVEALSPPWRYTGNICRAQWITGSLLAVLERPSFMKSDTSRVANKNPYRVAQVLGIVPGRSPEALTELALTPEDLNNENAHTQFELVTKGSAVRKTTLNSTALRNVNSDATSFLGSGLGLQYDAYSGCLAISSARISTNDTEKSQTILFFASIWHWRSNTSGFTAVSKTSLDDCRQHQPLSQFLLGRERMENKRCGTHLHSVFENSDCIRVRKDLYEMGLLCPPEDVRRNSALDGMNVCPLLLTSSSITFPQLSRPDSHSSEIEWQEAGIPVNYKLEFGSPVIASISTGGRSVAIASARGLCVLDCSPRPKKTSLASKRAYMFETAKPLAPDRNDYGVQNHLPPKWHLFGNESEERAFRVLSMSWWQGHSSNLNHASDDLLVAVVQLVEGDPESGDSAGTCYLACWSQRRLDTSHQRLRPLDPDLQSSRCQWGVRLNRSFQAKSLKLLAHPQALASHAEAKQRERKAVVMLTSCQDEVGLTQYIVFQLQVIPSIGRSQNSDSYVEHRPYSIFCLQASAGEMKTADDSSVATVFLASASFQFDLRRMRFGGSSTTEPSANEIVGTIGIIKSPGGGLDAVVLTSMGPSRISAVLESQGDDDTREALKCSEISSYWLSDFVHAQRSIVTSFQENALMDLYAWAFLRADGEMLTWFVPCLEFENCDMSQNVFSSRTLLGIVCPNGSASTWLQRSPAKTGKDFMVGSVPHSAYGCVLSTGQASRKFHRTIAGGFDHSLFASDFMEHEYLYTRDLDLSPPAFMSSVAALAKSSSFFLASNCNTGNKLQLLNPGGEDVEKALLAVDMGEHVVRRSTLHQESAFIALRLLVLRAVEQVSDDARKRKPAFDNHTILSSSVLSEVLHIVKRCSGSRLQFASLVLEVGRQLEPSCFSFLFPLPSVSPSTMAKGDASASSLTTLLACLGACIEDGSLVSSVSSLPIITSQDVSLHKCILLLDHCLAAFVENCTSQHDLFFDFTADERSVIGDIFRFGAKLEDTPDDEYVEFHLEHEFDGDSDDSTGSSDSNDDGHDDEKNQMSSLICVSWFSRKSSSPKHKTKSSELQNVTRKARQEKTGITPNGSVAGSVAKVLVQMAVSSAGENGSSSARNDGWKRSAALAFLVLGQGESILPKLSRTECESLIRQTAGVGGKTNGNQNGAESSLTDFLTRSMQACSREIGAKSASKILDLVLVLLARAKDSSNFDSYLPGLLVIGITAGHISERIHDILNVHDESASFTRSYLRGKEKLESPYYM